MKPAPDYALYLVTDGDLAAGRPLEHVVRKAVEGGVTVVQLREKSATTRQFLKTAFRMKELLAPHGVAFVINDRVDIALACGADGVHVGQDDMPVADARRIVGDDKIVGVSVSTPGEARQAEAGGADYLGVSPVFDTPTKADTPAATGLAGLRSIREATHLPLVAIGGIHAGNAEDAIGAGADGVAVVSAIMSADDPGAAARSIWKAVRKGRGKA